MPHSSRWAKRLIWELPNGDPGALLTRAAYADPVFCDLLHDHLDGVIFHNPREGLRWALVAPDHALLIPEESSPEGRQAHRERLVKAWAILGGAYRAAGDLIAAEEPYRQALALIDSESISELFKADIHRRLAYFRACQGRKDEALELSAGALATLRTVGQGSRELIEALVCRGYVLSDVCRYSEAIASHGEALKRTNPKDSPAAERLHLAAVHNLAYAVSMSREHPDKTAALEYIRRAKQLLRGQVRSVGRYRLLWVEGILWAAVGLDRRAEQAFRIALEGFQALDLPWEIALVGLDLGALLFGEWSELAELAGETFARFEILSAESEAGETEALAALAQWLAAIKAEKLTDEITGQARELIAAGAVRSCRQRRR